MTEYHRLEIQVMRQLSDGSERRLDEIADSLSLPVQSIYYGASLLEDRGLANVRQERKRSYELTSRGRKALETGLPEEILLEKALREGGTPVQEALQEMDRELAGIALGQAKSRKLVTLEKGIIQPTKRGRKEHGEKPVKRDLELIKSGGIPENPSLLLERGLAESTESTVRYASLNQEGLRESKQVEISKSIIDLSPQMIETGSWKGRKFKSFDIQAPAPPSPIAKKQPYRRFLDRIRRKLTSLGFEEMTGPLVELSFWNFDALFQPQNHPAREVHDTFRIAEPSHGELPEDEFVDRVGKVHEDGWKTGSRGWKYRWSREEASSLVGRTQGTALSVRTLASGIDPPCKHFSIARVFRPDILDRTHLIEFNQCEGIIADKDLTFRHLLGILRMFAQEIAHESNFAFVPSYYPFTEPSVDLVAYSKEAGEWVELGGAGIFREEVTAPFDVDIPVIAWGMGIDRLAMFSLGLNDIRELFSQKLDWLRKSEVVM